MKILLQTAAIAACLTAMPAVAQAADPNAKAAEAASNAPAGADAEKKICKRGDTTGTIMSRRVCLTKAQWDAIAEQSKRSLQDGRDLQNQHSTMQNQRGG